MPILENSHKVNSSMTVRALHNMGPLLLLMSDIISAEERCLDSNMFKGLDRDFDSVIKRALDVSWNPISAVATRGVHENHSQHHAVWEFWELLILDHIGHNGATWL